MTEQEQQLAVNADELATVEADRDELLAEREKLLAEPLPEPKGVEAASKREALAYAAGYESCQRDHAAEVKRLAAERDHWKANHDNQVRLKQNANELIQDFLNERDEVEEEVQREFDAEKAALTARVAELEADAKRLAVLFPAFRHALRRDESDAMHAIAKEAEVIEIRLVSPLPTAGDDACEVNPIVSRMCERGTKCCTVEHAPAEPDCPAEEQPSKLRDESWLREAADAEDQHASVCAGDMTPRKPVCLDGVPAVLCEWEASPGEYIRGWAFGSIVMGYVRYLDFEEMTMLYGDVHVSALHPIHHDPTDAAAVELAGRIAEGGGNGS